MRLLPLFLALLFAAIIAAPASASTDSIRGHDGRLLFRQADLAFNTGWQMPATGWERRAIPAPILTSELTKREAGAMTLWARVRFDSAELPAGPLAFYSIDTRERFILFLNGEEIYRNFSGPDDQMLGWNRPYLVQLPREKLRNGGNQLALRIDTGVFWHVGIGKLSIGPAAALEAEYSKAQFWRITGVMIANGVMLAFTVYALLLWMLGWREPRVLLWGVIGVFWLLRNLHFFVERPPFDAAVFREISQYLIYFVVALTYSFCAEVSNVRRRRLFNLLQYGFAVLVCVLRFVLIQREISDVLCNLLTMISGASVIYISLKEFLRSRQFDHFLILVGLVATAAFSAHDIGRTTNVQVWDGLGLFLQPYAGFVMALAFFVPIALNIVRAFRATSQLNQVLENKVQEVSVALRASEAKLRDQQVALAVNEERERLMREIHDGIGSNLVTALAVAERQQHPPESVATLKRSLSDLKLTVDSLEPVDGDVVVLLASLRHRLDPDLQKAGLSCQWSVADCPLLPWLDPVNALHLLRLIQEAVSNVVAHAQARIIAISCEPSPNQARDGVQIVVADDGIGFDLKESDHRGRGLRSMRSRAQSLGGEIDFDRSELGGVQVAIWLPLERS